MPSRARDVHGRPKASRKFCGTWSWDTSTAGMEGVYAHVTPESRAALTAADDADWKSSLAARAAMSPHSPVPVLDALLAPFRDSPDVRSTIRPAPGARPSQPGA